MSESRLGPGDHVGPYEIVALLGEGGMGQVYRACDPRLAREVALKIVRADVAPDKSSLLRFADEAKAASLLSHPNIVAVYDIGDSNGSPYIISELLQGETLRDRLAAGALPTRRAVDYGLQVLRGLAAAHDKGIVHRDLKPENLFLTKGGLVKILDFGIAKLGLRGEERAGTNADTRSNTDPGAIVGTAGYMSPEQVRGLVVDHRSDLFSFGAVLFEIILGQRAFKGTTVADTKSAVLRDDPVDASGSASTLPPGFLRVLRRALEKAPEDRFQTARDLAFALEGASTESGFTTSSGEPPAADRKSRLRMAGVALAAIVATAVLGTWFGRQTAPSPPLPSFKRLTFRTGRLNSARFASDGATILFSAQRTSDQPDVFSTRAGAGGERTEASNALLLAVSPKEMALMVRPKAFALDSFEGALARAPIGLETAAREVLEGVVAADWSHDEKNDLAVSHRVGDRCRLEYPIGHVLFAPDPPAWISQVRLSPHDDRIAFVEHPVAGDKHGSIAIVDLAGAERTLASGFAAVNALGWSPSGDEIWFSGSQSGLGQQIQAVSLSGTQRVLAETAGSFRLHDVSPAGQVLGSALTGWTQIRVRPRGATEERELPGTSVGFLSDISDDGKVLLATDIGDGGGPNFRFYAQKTDGSPALWLGEGDAQALSPDGRYVLAVLEHTDPQQLIVVPTGAGETRRLEPGVVVQYSRAVWDNTGHRVVFAGTDKQNSTRLYVQAIGGGPPTAVTGDGVRLDPLGKPVSPDGQRVVALGRDGVPALYPLAGGEAIPIPDLVHGDVTLCWTSDGRELIVAHYEDETPAPTRIDRIDVATGHARPWTRLSNATPAGIEGQYRVLVTPDGESYAYSYLRTMSDLYLTSKLQ